MSRRSAYLSLRACKYDVLHRKTGWCCRKQRQLGMELHQSFAHADHVTAPERPATPVVGPWATPEELAITCHPRPAAGEGKGKLPPPETDHPLRILSTFPELVRSGPIAALCPADAPRPAPTQRLWVCGFHATPPAGPTPTTPGTGTTTGRIQLTTQGLLAK